MGSLGGLQLRPVVGAGAVARGQVERVGGRQLELGRGRLDVGYHRVQERLLGLLQELEHRRQDRVGAAGLLLLPLVLREPAEGEGETERSES